ncbi:unnamed protein product [Thlaspi arvense]|uniref:Uncharacterized protein n=1 Tax=Thlaspi arvense TaxID=13288 RepID=A0AAU9RBU8_THLAR|nr:unnamed protein product [Thlaspi arvense]
MSVAYWDLKENRVTRVDIKGIRAGRDVDCIYSGQVENLINVDRRNNNQTKVLNISGWYASETLYELVVRTMSDKKCLRMKSGSLRN